jgi:hypothetical protein
MADEGPREVHVRIERREGRSAERIAWIAAIAIFVAMAKPWGSAGEPPPVPVRPAPRQTPVAVASQRVVDPDLPCVGGRWSVEADQRWVGSVVVRAWILTDAVQATGPLDERIQFVTVAAEEIVAIGFCAPFHDVHDGAAATFFRLDPSATPVETVPIAIGREAEAMPNVLYRPIPEVGASAVQAPTSWPSGRYVIRIDSPDGYRVWIGIDVRLIRMPSSTPASASPPVD